MRSSAVAAVLREIGADERPQLLVLNKIDRAAEGRESALAATRPGGVPVSALRGDGLSGLLDAVAGRLELRPHRVRLRFEAEDRRRIAAVYAAGRVLSHVEDGGHVDLDAELPQRLVDRYREHVR